MDIQSKEIESQISVCNYIVYNYKKYILICVF